MTALLVACLALLTGLVIGAGLQRWGDAERATHGHTLYPPPDMADTEYGAYD